MEQHAQRLEWKYKFKELVARRGWKRTEKADTWPLKPNSRFKWTINSLFEPLFPSLTHAVAVSAIWTVCMLSYIRYTSLCFSSRIRISHPATQNKIESGWVLLTLHSYFLYFLNEYKTSSGWGGDCDVLCLHLLSTSTNQSNPLTQPKRLASVVAIFQCKGGKNLTSDKARNRSWYGRHLDIFVPYIGNVNLQSSRVELCNQYWFEAEYHHSQHLHAALQKRPMTWIELPGPTLIILSAFPGKGSLWLGIQEMAPVCQLMQQNRMTSHWSGCIWSPPRSMNITLESDHLDSHEELRRSHNYETSFHLMMQEKGDLVFFTLVNGRS